MAETRRGVYLRRKYGITEEQYQALSDSHGGRCWVCGVVPKNSLHVDHDHRPPFEIRGLLDWSCNRFLDYRWTPERLLAAARYMTEPFTGLFVPPKKRKKRKR